jgi:hypothetical protein
MALRLTSLVSTLLAAYLALVANLGLVTLVLSPFREVTRGGLLAAEAVLLLGAVVVWLIRGRPVVPFEGARSALRLALSDPATGVFLVFVVALLAYELLLALGEPPNNGDALGYHLPRAAAWAQHGGIFWIPNAPSIRMNGFQPLAEQEILFAFVATGGQALLAMPQFIAQLAIIVAVYGAARRLGFGVRSAVCGACLLATFSLVALEATTAQNDLVVGSFPAVAACLLIGGGMTEAALGGAAAGMALGVKLTAVLVLPVIAWLALVRGRRVFAIAVAGAAAGFAALGVWGYVLNAVHTGQVLGAGTAVWEDRASPSYPGSVANAFDLVYGMMDVSVLSTRVIYLLALAGVLGGAAALVLISRRGSRPRAARTAASAAIPFLAPLAVLAGGAVVAYAAYLWGFPIRGPTGIVTSVNDNLSEIYTHISNEDYSAFGPVGIVSLVVASVLALYAVARRRADSRQLALALSLPLFLVLISLETFWNPFLIRFFLVPAVLVGPLLARLFTSRVTTAAYALVAGLTVALTVIHDQTKPLFNPYGFGVPWNLTQQNALATNSRDEYATALRNYQRLVPAGACVGAVLGNSDPSYLLFGPNLEHRVLYLSAIDPVLPALRSGLAYVVINPSIETGVPGAFRVVHWKLTSLGYWLLASAPYAKGGTC